MSKSNYWRQGDISIHTLHTEGDYGVLAQSVERAEFQSTPSTRRVTKERCAVLSIARFQSTPSTRRVTMQVISDAKELEFQSTPSTRRVT